MFDAVTDPTKIILQVFVAHKASVRISRVSY